MLRPWTADMISEHLEAPAGITYFIDPQGHIVGSPENAAGYLLGMRTRDSDDLLRVAVLPDYRGRGFARALIEAFTTGRKHVLLEVSRDNADALALYEACGFRKIHTRKGYYQGTDCIVMELTAH